MIGRKTALAALALAAALAFAGTAEAAPSGKDSRAATAAARAANAMAVDAARAGEPGAGEALRSAVRLDRRASRVAARVVAARGGSGGARLMRAAAGGVDDGIDGLSEVLATVPPELQVEIAAALEKLHALRDELVGKLTVLVDELPTAARDKVLAAIARFQSDGDLEALVGALGDPDVVVAVRERLEALLGEVTDSIRSHLGELEEVLPPGALDELQAAFDRVAAHLDEVMEQLAEILGEGPGGPPALPDDLCAGLEELFAELGLPVPPGLCPATP